MSSIICLFLSFLDDSAKHKSKHKKHKKEKHRKSKEKSDKINHLIDNKTTSLGELLILSTARLEGCN